MHKCCTSFVELGLAAAHAVDEHVGSRGASAAREISRRLSLRGSKRRAQGLGALGSRLPRCAAGQPVHRVEDVASESAVSVYTPAPDTLHHIAAPRLGTPNKARRGGTRLVGLRAQGQDFWARHR